MRLLPACHLAIARYAAVETPAAPRDGRRKEAAGERIAEMRRAAARRARRRAFFDSRPGHMIAAFIGGQHVSRPTRQPLAHDTLHELVISLSTTATPPTQRLRFFSDSKPICRRAAGQAVAAACSPRSCYRTPLTPTMRPHRQRRRPLSLLRERHRSPLSRELGRF